MWRSPNLVSGVVDDPPRIIVLTLSLDVLAALVGLTSWSVLLNEYIIDQLFALNRQLDVSDDFDIEALRDRRKVHPRAPRLRPN
jgi:hypothetical protein